MKKKDKSGWYWVADYIYINIAKHFNKTEGANESTKLDDYAEIAYIDEEGKIYRSSFTYKIIILKHLQYQN